MTETADTVDPTLTAAQIDYGSGIITFDADETLDFTPVGGQGYDNFNMAPKFSDRPGQHNGGDARSRMQRVDNVFRRPSQFRPQCVALRASPGGATVHEAGGTQTIDLIKSIVYNMVSRICMQTCQWCAIIENLKTCIGIRSPITSIPNTRSAIHILAQLTS